MMNVIGGRAERYVFAKNCAGAQFLANAEFVLSHCCAGGWDGNWERFSEVRILFPTLFEVLSPEG